MNLIHLFLIVGMLMAAGCTKKAPTHILELEKKAEAGDAFAQFNLGNAYYKRNDVPQDYKEAVKWFTKAADHKWGAPKAKLGECYLNGIGVAKDKKEAVKWFTKAGYSPEVIEAIVKMRSK